jgi:aminopeptidase-like protein
MRKMFGEYKEYHTSLDNEDLINFDTIISTIKAYYEVLLTIESNFIPFGKIQFGTPQLSKSKVNLYKDIMDFGSEGKGERISTILQILNLADGKLDLLEIANAKNFKLINHINTIKDLLKSGYIKRINKKIQ